MSFRAKLEILSTIGLNLCLIKHYEISIFVANDIFSQSYYQQADSMTEIITVSKSQTI